MVREESIDYASCVYALYDPRSPEVIRYVGKTKHCAQARLRSHLKDTEHTHKARWLRKLACQGIEPALKVLEHAAPENLSAVECVWIEKLREAGHPLTNSTKGGESGPGAPPGNQYAKGHKHSEETRARLSEAGKGRRLSEHQKTRLFEGRDSEEARRKKSEAMKGNQNAKGHIGMKRSEETKARISEARSKQVMQPHVAEATSKRMQGNQYAKGKKWSEERKKAHGDRIRHINAKKRAMLNNTPRGV